MRDRLYISLSLVVYEIHTDSERYIACRLYISLSLCESHIQILTDPSVRVCVNLREMVVYERDI